METLIPNDVVEPCSAPLTAEPRETPANEFRGPLFVIGMWRSGTSLLYALLNKHPQIALMYEGDLPLLRPLFWMPGASSRWQTRWEFWNQALERHGLQSKLPAGVNGLPEAARAAYREYAHQAGAQIGGDKSPNYFDHLTQLADDFPEARFIVIWRDPASICRSVIRAAEEKHSWFSRKGMPLRVLLGMKAMRSECDKLVLRGARLHELDYQRLVGDPVASMQAICRFLDIPYVPEVASLSGAKTSAIYEGGHHSLVKGDKIVASTKRDEVLSPELKSKIDRYMTLWLEESGGVWPPSSKKPETGERPSAAEHIADRIRYRWLRAFDAAVIFLYCFAPIFLLTKFREAKRNREEARARLNAAYSRDKPPAQEKAQVRTVTASQSK